MVSNGTGLAVLAMAVTLATATQAQARLPPIRVLLVGDSTMAKGSGYGDALCARFEPSVTCENLAKGGRSSRSYRREGSWKAVMDRLAAGGSFTATYVLIQFGHNDQPRGVAATEPTGEFRAWMAAYAIDARLAGAKVILVTPLSRRFFDAFKVRQGLLPWAQATSAVAAEEKVPVLDLHTDSVIRLQADGPAVADSYAQAPPPASVTVGYASGTSVEAPKPGVFDYTHLGPRGAEVFAEIVANELRQIAPELTVHLKPISASPGGGGAWPK